MCGIVGLIGKTPLDFRDACDLQLISDAMVHRGPDGEGRFQAEQFAMAMRRLSIIDLSGGWQPLYNEDKSIALVANGEVYNFVELRADLEARGHQFRTKSDCETIAHLYEEYGDDCVHHLRGMYAFSLYDSKRQRVLIVRDRMGEKPMYLIQQPNRIFFASELRCLMRSGVVPFELDPVAVFEFFHYQYVPEPRCIIKGIRKLQAGHLLKVDLKTWKVDERPYWRMEDAPPVDGDPAKVVRNELERIGELIVRSDVPVGIALSSGVDSSAIAALAQKNYPGLLQGFTVGYEGSPRQDERVAAKRFADHINMPLNAVELRDDEVVEDFGNMVFFRDDPIADIAGTGYLAVMRAARAKGVRVMLMGHGGDELFGGYWWVQEALQRSKLKRGLHASPRTTKASDYLRVTKPPRSIGLGLRWLRNGGGLFTGLRHYRYDKRTAADRLVHYDHSAEFERAGSTLPRIATSAFRDSVSYVDLTERFAAKLPWDHVDVEIARLTCQTYLQENGLAQGDRLSMAASVELRVPLVDYRFVETVVGLMKTHPEGQAKPKQWLRDAVSDLVPDFVMNRPKTGFNAPSKRWMPKVMAAYGHLLEDGHLVKAGILKPGLDVETAGFHALTLEIWCRQMYAASLTKPSDLSTIAASANRERLSV